MPNSKVDDVRNRIMKQAYNATTQAEATKAIKNRTPAYQGQIDVTKIITKHDVPGLPPRAGQSKWKFKRKKINAAATAELHPSRQTDQRFCWGCMDN